MTINIGHFLTKRAFLSPELEATVEPSAGGRRQTFRQLNTRCNQVANALRTAGLLGFSGLLVILASGIGIWIAMDRLVLGREVQKSGGPALVFGADLQV